MQITNVLAGVAVRDLEQAKRWYAVLFGREPDAEPMGRLAEWHTGHGDVQLIADEQRAGGSLLAFHVPDAQRALDELAARGGPEAELDEDSSGQVRFATVLDPDGNAVTVVQLREGATL